MNEREVLELSLWVFCIGFVVKGATFAYLGWSMRHQRDETGVGPALRSHYISLSLQAVVLAFLYLYYATAIRGHHEWLSSNARVALYIVGTVFVAWATVQGVRLMIAYWQATRDERSDS
jgi:small-conductance mechanosensitive channel